MKRVLRYFYRMLPLPIRQGVLNSYFWGREKGADFIFLAQIIWGKFIRLFKPVPVNNGAGRLNIHLGCGPINHPAFVNVDGFPFPHVHYVHRIDKLPMFNSNTADLVYASHCLEHFPYRSIKDVLLEWNRILKVGGVLRLSVPDFDKLILIAQNNNNDPDVIIEQLMGGQNNKFNYHLAVFNRVNLEKVLFESGFSEPEEWLPGSEELTSFDDFSGYQKNVNNKYYEVSLNLQARKVQ